jgi:hypothetical protein
MGTGRVGLIGVLVLGLVGGWGSVGSAGGVSKAQVCEASKLTAAGLKASCLAIEEAKGVLGATARPERCDAAFAKAFAKAEKFAGGACPTTGDTVAIEGLVDACVADIADALSGGGSSNGCAQSPATGQTTAYTADKNDGIGGAIAVPDDGTVEAGATLSYTDNGDGTITDNNTGLMWEKKSDDGSIHDKDTEYTWDNAFAVHIAGLNAGPGFAGRARYPGVVAPLVLNAIRSPMEALLRPPP